MLVIIDTIDWLTKNYLKMSSLKAELVADPNHRYSMFSQGITKFFGCERRPPVAQALLLRFAYVIYSA